MPRIGFVSAVFISIVLIVGALWFRFIRIPPYSADLASIQRVEQSSSDNTLLEDFSNASASLPATSTTPLTRTQLISRELFSDYIALKSQGNVSSSTVNALASKYAENIANFDLTIQKVSRSQINVILDSEADLATYGNTIANIRNKNKKIVASLVKDGGDSIGEIGSPAFSTFMSAVGKLYKTSADELLRVKVPTSLAENHMNLINNYLGSAMALETFINNSTEPTQGYAAISVFVKNNGEEANLLLNIQKTLMANGIILSNGVWTIEN